MAVGKRKFIEDAALVIDGRMAALKAELARDEAMGRTGIETAPDRAAILEAEHCARLIRALGGAPYLGPKAAVAALDEYERGRRQANERIRDLLEANDRYLNDARSARAELQAFRAAMKVRH